MKICLCCIGKKENQYIKEFVNHYKKLGFDKIFLYDNNDIEGEHFEDVIDNDIKNEFVEIIDFRGEKICQLKAYQDCYNKHNKEYDWFAFFDCDEFLTLSQDENIKKYLSREMFMNYDMIHINWMLYGDNELLGNENNNDRSLQNRFTQPLPYDIVGFGWCYGGAENDHIKSIIRGGRNVNWIGSWNPHTPINDLKCCSNNGRLVNEKTPWIPYNFDYAHIKHYITKTITEWAEKKERGYCDQPDEVAKKNLSLDRFFKINHMTISKLNILRDKKLIK